MIVPGSGLVKEQAEAEGLDKIFKAAGFEWREPGCSMCLAMNPDQLAPGERCASTSNRNFEGRQGYQGPHAPRLARRWRRRRRSPATSSTSANGRWPRLERARRGRPAGAGLRPAAALARPAWRSACSAAASTRRMRAIAMPASSPDAARPRPRLVAGHARQPPQGQRGPAAARSASPPPGASPRHPRIDVTGIEAAIGARYTYDTICG